MGKDRTPRTGKYMSVRRSVSVKLKYIHSSLDFKNINDMLEIFIGDAQTLQSSLGVRYISGGGGLKCRNVKWGNVEIFASKTIVNMILIDAATSL